MLLNWSVIFSNFHNRIHQQEAPVFSKNMYLLVYFILCAQSDNLLKVEKTHAYKLRSIGWVTFWAYS